MELEILSRSYSIKLNKDEFLTILDKDELLEVRNYPWLWKQLEYIQGVDDVEHDGHFGTYVYFTIKEEYNDGKLEKVMETIKNYIEKDQYNRDEIIKE